MRVGEQRVDHHPPVIGEVRGRGVELGAVTELTVATATVALRGNPVRSAAAGNQRYGSGGSGVDGDAAGRGERGLTRRDRARRGGRARQEAQSARREQVIFPDDLLPGVNSEPVYVHARRSQGGGKLMFVVLGLLLVVRRARGRRDPGARARDPRARSTSAAGTIVFIATASSAFFVLGAVPMGWLADRVKRVPIVGVAEPRRSACFVFLSGARGQRVHAVLDALRHRHRQGEQHPGAPVAASPTTTRSASAPGCRR